MLLRKFLICVIVLMTILTIGYGWIMLNSTPPISQIQTRLPPMSQLPVRPDVPELIEEINAKNAQIKSLASDDIEVKVWEGGQRYSLSGSVNYEKDHNFRMIVRSIFGKELDLGSNNELFWFWSRRNKTPGLHFAVYEDYYKTRLKTPFNPIWMRTTFGIDEIELNGSYLIENDKDYIIVREDKNAMGREIMNAVFVSKEQKRITAVMITDPKGAPLASCEITEANSDGLPKKIMFTWYEENKIMLLEIGEIQANRTLNPNLWELPDIRPKVDMGKE